MPKYRFEVLEFDGEEPSVVDTWTSDLDDDDAAWKVASTVLLSGLQQARVFREGDDRPFGSSVSDGLADAWGAP